MRCYCYRCDYNDEGYCSQPDYVTIDYKGECDQLYVKRVLPDEDCFEEE
jgi:hypothetical protein